MGLCPALGPCPSLWMTSPPRTEVTPGSAAIQLPPVMHMCPLDSLLENLTPSLRVAHTHPYTYTCKQHDTALTQSRPMIMAKKHESFSPLLCFSSLKGRDAGPSVGRERGRRCCCPPSSPAPAPPGPALARQLHCNCWRASSSFRTLLTWGGVWCPW